MLEQATKAQKASRGMALLFFLTPAIIGGGRSTSRSDRFTPGKETVPIV